MFHVGLIFPELVVIARLDQAATWDEDPPGDPSEGYDPILGEPYVYHSSGVRTSTRQEMAEITIPCQYEEISENRLRTIFTGDAPVTQVTLVLDMQDLRDNSLISSSTGDCLLKPGDRIVRLETKTGIVTRTFKDELYIYEVRSGSHGFGKTGYDLYNVFTTYRSPTRSGQ